MMMMMMMMMRFLFGRGMFVMCDWMKVTTLRYVRISMTLVSFRLKAHVR